MRGQVDESMGIIGHISFDISHLSFGFARHVLLALIEDSNLGLKK
jgi:hypothetical protein